MLTTAAARTVDPRSTPSSGMLVSSSTKNSGGASNRTDSEWLFSVSVSPPAAVTLMRKSRLKRPAVVFERRLDGRPPPGSEGPQADGVRVGDAPPAVCDPFFGEDFQRFPRGGVQTEVLDGRRRTDLGNEARSFNEAAGRSPADAPISWAAPGCRPPYSPTGRWGHRISASCRTRTTSGS